MKTWVYDPQSGGSSKKPILKEEFLAQAKRHVKKVRAFKDYDFEFPFKGQ